MLRGFMMRMCRKFVVFVLLNCMHVLYSSGAKQTVFDEISSIHQQVEISPAMLEALYQHAQSYCQQAQKSALSHARGQWYESFEIRKKEYYEQHCAALSLMIAAYPDILFGEIYAFQKLKDPRILNWLYWLTDLKNPRRCADEIVTKIEVMCRMF